MTYVKFHSPSIRAILAVLLGSIFLFAHAAHAAVTLPEETFTASQQLNAVLLDVQQKSFDSAAERMQSLLQKHGSELTRGGDDGLISVHQFFATLPANDAASLQRVYETKFGSVADESLKQVRARPDYRPQDLYTIAEQFPLSQAAMVALAAAGDRAADQGDLISSRVFYQLAAKRGWTAPADHHQINTSGVDGAFGVSGPLPFDAPWFNLASGFESSKIFPVGSGNVAFVASEKTAIALSPDGVVAWRWRASDHQQTHGPRFQLGDTNRGRLLVPAVLSDKTGRARIIVIWQNVFHDGNGCLVALRAGDGRLLWSTESDPVMGSVSFLGSPVIAGRYVVAVGLQTAANDAESASLLVFALDVTSGHLLWRTQLAAINISQRSRDLDLYRDQSPPGIFGDCVVISPNVGAVYAADLFDGQLRWVRPYRKAAINDGAIRKYEDQRTRGRDLIAPLAWTDILRWTCTPQCSADVVMLAPQDTLSMIGLDVATGRLLWENSSLPQATPVGVAGDKLILSGAEITAVDPKTGITAWTYTPVTGLRLTGPAVVRSDQILVRSTAGLLSISPADGRSSPSRDTADFHLVAASDAGKSALAGAQISNAFGTPLAGNRDRKQ
jgi:outer membrane protein assembly factor BamB